MVDHHLLATIRSSPLLLKDPSEHKPNAQMPLRRLQKMCSPETNRHCGFFFFFFQATALTHQPQSWCPLGLLRIKKEHLQMWHLHQYGAFYLRRTSQ